MSEQCTPSGAQAECMSLTARLLQAHLMACLRIRADHVRAIMQAYDIQVDESLIRWKKIGDE